MFSSESQAKDEASHDSADEPRFLKVWDGTAVLEEEGSPGEVASALAGDYVRLSDNSHLGVVTGARGTPSGPAKRFISVHPHTRTKKPLEPRSSIEADVNIVELPVIHESVLDWLAADKGDTEIDLLITLKREPGWNVNREATRAAILNELTESEAAAQRKTLRDSYAHEMEVLQEDFIEHVAAHGIRVTEQFSIINALVASANKDNINTVLDHSSVKHVMDATFSAEMEPVLEDPDASIRGGPPTIDEPHVWNFVEASGLSKYRDGRIYEGSGRTMAIIEHDFTLTDLANRPFLDDYKLDLVCAWFPYFHCWWEYKVGPRRIISVWDCQNYPCVELSYPFLPIMSTDPDSYVNDLTPANHAWQVSAIAMANAGPDIEYFASYGPPGLPLDEARPRSGVAPKAEAHLILTTDKGANTTIRAINLAAELEVDIINYSGGAAPHCCGTCATVEALNNANRNFSVLTVKTAGNQGQDEGCSVTAPGEAALAFTVGGTTYEADGCDSSDWNCRIQNAHIYSQSSRGGADYLGITSARSLIDVVAPAQQNEVAQWFECNLWHEPDDLWHTYRPTLFGTSFAAPAVAGAALLFREWWIDQFSGFVPIWIIRDPNLLAINLLLMTDRQGESGLLSSGFDSVWGGGRLSMLKFDNEGMGHNDWIWETGWTFVESGWTNVCINNCEPTSFPVQKVETVIKWKEPFADVYSTQGADIVLYLQKGCDYPGWEPGMSPQWSSVADDYSWDTKKRVAMSFSDETACWRFAIPGWVVPSNPWESGESIRKVYYATAMNHR